MHGPLLFGGQEAFPLKNRLGRPPKSGLQPSPSTKKADPRTSHGTVWRVLNALVDCGLAHREILPEVGILRYAPVKIECAHERVACKDCGATIPRKETNMSM